MRAKLKVYDDGEHMLPGHLATNCRVLRIPLRSTVYLECATINGGKRFVRQLLNPLQVPLRQIVKLNLALALPLPLLLPSRVHRNGKFISINLRWDLAMLLSFLFRS